MNEKKEAYHLCIRVSCIFLKGANKFYPFIGDLVMVSRFRLNKHISLHYLHNVNLYVNIYFNLQRKFLTHLTYILNGRKIT